MSKKKDTGEISQTVEESNKLRESLGLRPLETDAKKTSKGSSNNPLEGLPDKAGKQTDADSKKRAAAAKTKKDHAELTKGDGLGDILAREEGTGGAADWISRTRGKEGSMKTPAAAAAAASSKDSGKKKGGSGDALSGMKVRHDETALQDGSEVTLTLSDQPILDADGNINENMQDELSNARMLDDEKAKHNEAVKNRKEYDATLQGQDILEKYNELKTGPKGFIIGGTPMGMIDEADPEKRLALLTAMSEKQSLESKTKLQSDFYTAEEMNKFRKAPKKKAKKRKQEKEGKEEQMLGPDKTVDTGRPADAGSDEEDPELYEQLSKQRRLVRRSDAGAVRKGEAALTAVSERISTLEAHEDPEKETAVKKDGDISMTATTEFCNVVQTPLEKMDTMKHESFRGSTLYKQQVAQRKGLKMSQQRNKGKDFSLDNEDAPAFDEKDAEVETLTEDQLDLSCASGLAYLRARAQIGNDQDSHKNRKSDNRPLEMSKLDGDIKLEYRDDFGRVQTPKEAFRAISWKFHGKVPGRKNMERRILRLENEMRLKSMNPIESLPTLRALRHVQHADAKPYMVLSGANEK